MEWHGSQMFDAAGEFEFLFGVGIDITELKATQARVKVLSGLLPICSSCKKIRDDTGYWNRIEAYIHDHSEADFTHGICPTCARELYPELYEDEK